jgi:hypothetical protein
VAGARVGTGTGTGTGIIRALVVGRWSLVVGPEKETGKVVCGFHFDGCLGPWISPPRIEVVLVPSFFFLYQQQQQVNNKLTTS